MIGPHAASSANLCARNGEACRLKNSGKLPNVSPLTCCGTPPTCTGHATLASTWPTTAKLTRPCTLIWLAKKGIRFYLPILHPIYPGKLVFSPPYYDGVQLTANRFGIPEPPPFPRSRRKPAWALDAVLFPLVGGFDETGGRLGMGGGFYDRTFAFSRIRPCMAPKLVGLAHDFQRVEQLPVEPWDVPLHGVVTDKRCYRFRP